MIRRIASVDLLRGAVMVIMALDHTRDFFHAGAMHFRPEDLSQTTPLIFLTRWITHFCAPVFVFTAGLGAWFRLERTGDRRDLARFLVTRGAWLVVLEVTAVRFAFFFNWTYDPTFPLVFWVIGLGMVALAGLIWLPLPVLAAVSVGVIALHNVVAPLPGQALAALGSWAPLAVILHQPGVIWPSPLVIVGYPLVPWVFVMSAGFCFGALYRLAPERRRRLFIGMGLALIAAFVTLRGLNLYGDPRPWSLQPTGLFTALSFLDTTKNAPSLLFLLMTLGPAILVLGLIDRAQPSRAHPLIVFGRTPLFYFIVHFALIHVLAIAAGWWRYGWQPFLLTPTPTLGTPLDQFPPDYGWSLSTTYLAWITVVALLYPVCRWFAALKQRRTDWWLGYL